MRTARQATPGTAGRATPGHPGRQPQNSPAGVPVPSAFRKKYPRSIGSGGGILRKPHDAARRGYFASLGLRARAFFASSALSTSISKSERTFM